MADGRITRSQTKQLVSDDDDIEYVSGKETENMEADQGGEQVNIRQSPPPDERSAGPSSDGSDRPTTVRSPVHFLSVEADIHVEPTRGAREVGVGNRPSPITVRRDDSQGDRGQTERFEDDTWARGGKRPPG
jgi:hypothetical protein